MYMNWGQESIRQAESQYRDLLLGQGYGQMGFAFRLLKGLCLSKNIDSIKAAKMVCLRFSLLVLTRANQDFMFFLLKRKKKNSSLALNVLSWLLSEFSCKRFPTLSLQIIHIAVEK